MTPPETVLVQRGQPVGYRPARGSWRCARTEGEHVLHVAFMGHPIGLPREGRPLYVGTARTVGEALLVQVAPRPELVRMLRRKRAVGRVGVVRVEVEDGWRGRTVLDAASGRPRAVFDGAALLRPDLSAAGGDEPAAIGLGDDRPSWWTAHAVSGTAGVHLVHVADADGPSAPLRPERRVEVRGREGTHHVERDGRRLLTRSVSWAERGATVSVRSDEPGGRHATDGVLSLAELVAFANALV